MQREIVSVGDLKLPSCEIPRAEDRVVWYQDAEQMSGRLIGHQSSGQPCIMNDFESMSVLPSFDYIRSEDPFSPLGPNWERLPERGNIVRPHDAEIRTLTTLLEEVTRPGPRYIDLVMEIWSRGYEIYVVGGTVRDVINDAPSKDVDLVTTMPLEKAKALVRSMYRQFKYQDNLPNRALANGHLHLGGARGSSDPFIDLCVFKRQLPGTSDAIFGADFKRDLEHRDFACNCVYYDPVNKVFIDPSGSGVADAEAKTLNMVSSCKNNFHTGKVIIRFFKFLSRGYAASEVCKAKIQQFFNPGLSALGQSQRMSYARGQLLGKSPASDHQRIWEEFKVRFVEFSSEELWETYFSSGTEDTP